MSCQIILMDTNNNHAFEVDEVVDVVAIGVYLGDKVYNNPKFKIIQSDIPIEEAQVLLEPEYDVFMNVVKQRDKLLQTRDILEKEIEMARSEVVDRVVVKESESFEQTKDIIVG